MSQRHPVRSSRPSKPPLPHRRGHSYNHAQLPGNGSANNKPVAGSSRKAGTASERQDDEVEESMASFLQFCATCEKQIFTPGNSNLYCSAACRRRDASKSPPTAMPLSPLAISSATSYFGHPAADIVQQRSPTTLRPLSVAFSDVSSSDTGSPVEDSHMQLGRRDSEAAHYLAQFHPDSFASQATSTRRSRANRASATMESGLPSLINTPSSSFGTAASMSSYKPLPPRHDPTTGHCPTRSIDLVTPWCPASAASSTSQMTTDASLKSCASTLTSFRVAEAEDVSFQRRKPSWRYSDSASGSLKQLFSHKAMQGPPTEE